MSELHNYGLIRFSKKTGKIDTTLTALGKGMIQLWALQNTPKTKACVIVDIDEAKPLAEYVGTADGFPKVHKNIEDFEFNLPDKLFDFFKDEIKEKDDSLNSKIDKAKKKQGDVPEKTGNSKEIVK